MNQRKLDLLNKAVKEKRKYKILIDRNVVNVKGRYDKLLKPYYSFNKTKQYFTKKFINSVN